MIRLYREAAKKADFPGKYRFALCFPESRESRRISGQLPANVFKESIWTGAHLEDLEGSLERLWGGVFRASHEVASAVRELLDKVLAPRCRIFASLEDKIVAFQRQAEIVLTEEQ